MINFSLRAAHEHVLADLKMELDEVKRLRDNSLREVGELRGSVHVAEEHKARLQRDLHDAQRKIKDGTNPSLTLSTKISSSLFE
jgi:signal transduction histidine kinase